MCICIVYIYICIHTLIQTDRQTDRRAHMYKADCEQNARPGEEELTDRARSSELATSQGTRPQELSKLGVTKRGSVGVL